MEYNPYVLLDIIINGEPSTARPIEFDSEISDTKNSTNSFGNPVKPTKLSTTCPKCGQGIVINVRLDNPPFSVIYVICEECNPVTQVIDPFVNPIALGLIKLALIPAQITVDHIKSSPSSYDFDFAKPRGKVVIEPNVDLNDEIEFDDEELIDSE